MRFLHLADLHIGKLLHQYNMLPDQRLILTQILEIAEKEQVDAVLIAGDVYQRNNPSAEAMTVFSDFLSALVRMHKPCFLISGNHDSAARVSYLSEIADAAGIHIAGAEAEHGESGVLREHGGRCGTSLHAHHREDGQCGRQGAPAETGKIIDTGNARNRSHWLLLLLHTIKIQDFQDIIPRFPQKSKHF